MKVGRRPGIRLALAACLVGVLLTACTVAEPRSEPATISPTPSGASSPGTQAGPASSGPGSTLPSAEVSRYPTSRPLQPVPKVRLPGVVEPPPGRGIERYRQQRVSWSECPDAPGACASVLAPLDYTRPNEQAVTLAVRKIPATAKPRLGGLFLNPGGPGGSGWDMISWFDREGLDQFDVLSWDPRGVGRSTPVRCDMRAEARYVEADGSPDNPEEMRLMVDLARISGAACLARSGSLLAHVSTEETVRDLDLLRGLVGDPKLTYYGQSYGTAIGSLYATMFPDRVGRMVLDSTFTLDDDEMWTATYGFERQLHAFAGDCVSVPPCRLGGSEEEVLQRISQLFADLDTAPLPVGDRFLTETEAVRAVRGQLSWPKQEWYRLRTALYAAIGSKIGVSLLELADQDLQRQPDGTLGEEHAAFPAVLCLDSPDVSVQERLAVASRVAESSPVLGPQLGLYVGCALWPVAPRPNPPIGGTVPPLLIVGTTGDPVTPYEYAVSTTRRFPGSVLLTFEGHGHVAQWQSPCVEGHVVAYLVRGDLPAADTRCAS